MKEQPLMAFWGHDSFPFLLHGEVEAIKERGLVQPKGYGGYLFKPLILLPLEEGEKFAEKLARLKDEHRKEIKKVQTEFRSDLIGVAGTHGLNLYHLKEK